MRIESGFAELNGARIYWEAAGEGTPLVLVHGFTLDRRMWDDQFETFAAQHRTVRYDVRGSGRSDPPTAAPYSNHDDLRLLMDALGIERAHLCGLSFGGGVAFDFALELPGRVLSVVAIASALGGATNDMGSMNAPMIAMAGAAQEGDLAAVRRTWLDSPIFVPANRDPEVARRLEEMVEDWSVWQLTGGANHVDPEPPPAERLDQLLAPTLVINGELDNEVMLAAAARVEAEAPNARRVVVPDVGHLANMEAPAVINDLVLGFLA